MSLLHAGVSVHSMQVTGAANPCIVWLCLLLHLMKRLPLELLLWMKLLLVVLILWF